MDEIQQSQGNGVAVLLKQIEELETKMSEASDKAAQIAAEVAIKEYLKRQKDERQQRVNRMLHNIKLLLKNYRMLKINSQDAVFSLDQVEMPYEILESMMQGRDGTLQVDSIKSSAARTKIIVEHIERMLRIYEAYANDSSGDLIERRRYDVLCDNFLAEPPLNVKEIADKYGISKETVYGDRNVALERMAALIFGVDGLTAR